MALYIHVPFCISLCPYCDFVVYAGAAARGPRARIAAFLDAVLTEIDLRADALDDRFGSSRPPRSRACTSAAERPRSCRLRTSSDCSRACASGSTSPGTPRSPSRRTPGRTNAATPQPGAAPASPASRSGPNRSTTPSCGDSDGATARRTWPRPWRALARRASRSINLDLLYDTPDGTLATWTATLAAALELGPDHLSLYALTLDDPDGEGLTGPGGDHLPTTSGARRWRERARLVQDEDRAAAQYQHATSVLAEAGFRGYEISNWARPGHESRHNLAYWQRRPYEAVGPGAHAFDGAVRRWNAARLEGYVAALTGPHPALPPGGADVVDGAAATAETLILGLRLDTGVPLAMADEPPLADAFGWARAAELLDVTADDRVVLTTRGRLLSNELLARLV